MKLFVSSRVRNAHNSKRKLLNQVPLAGTVLVLSVQILPVSRIWLRPKLSLQSSSRATVRLSRQPSNSKALVWQPNRPIAPPSSRAHSRLLALARVLNKLLCKALRPSLQPVRQNSRQIRRILRPAISSSCKSVAIPSRPHSSWQTLPWVLVRCRAAQRHLHSPLASSLTNVLKKTSSVLVRLMTVYRSTATATRVTRRPRSVLSLRTLRRRSQKQLAWLRRLTASSTRPWTTRRPLKIVRIVSMAVVLMSIPWAGLL